MDYGYRNAFKDNMYSLRGDCYERRANPGSLACSWEKNTELFYNAGNETFQTIDTSLERMTRSTTNRMREVGKQGENRDAPASVVSGAAHETSVCTRFEWYWLLLPVILLVATGILLAAVVLGGLFNRQAHPP